MNINGYYYYQWTNQEVREVLVLYNNGVCLETSIEGSENYELANNIQNGLNPNYRNIKFVWGLYNIYDTIIQIEKWYPSEVYFPVYKRIGRVLNDSTFTITNSSRCDGSEGATQEEIWHFKPYSNKPDSTNPYIE